MKIHCLGTAGYHPNDTRQTSCYYLPEAGIALDAGTGTYRLPNVLAGTSLNILLSHAHLDHTAGLTFLLDVLANHPLDEIQIWGESEKLAAVRDHLFHPLIFPAKLNASWNPIDDAAEFAIGETKVSWRRQNHPGGSVAYRLDWPNGKRLVYSTDTTGDSSPEYVEWSRHADLLMHECYFRNEASEWAQETGHSWTDRVAEIATLNTPKKLLLTHMNPLEHASDPVQSDLIRERIDAETLIAKDGLKIEF
ncbi:MAG: MBL fold metallo-hydrolase [Rubripirellula sp.]